MFDVETIFKILSIRFLKHIIILKYSLNSFSNNRKFNTPIKISQNKNFFQDVIPSWIKLL